MPPSSPNHAIPPVDPSYLKEDLLRPIPKISIKTLLGIMMGVGIVLWGMQGTEVLAQDYTKALPHLLGNLSRWFPPNFNIVWTEWELSSRVIPLFSIPLPDINVPYPSSLVPIVETVQMAVMGTLLGVILSLPFGFLAARNTAPHALVYSITRMLLNINRTIPDIVFAMIFVAGFGMGPFPGVLALAIGAIGTLGKVFAEAVEAIDPQQVLAVRATGANRMLSFLYGVLPQSLPAMASYSLLYFEHNIRSATILGMVGAGGIGFTIFDLFNRFKFQELMATVILLIVIVTLIDRISDWLRTKII